MYLNFWCLCLDRYVPFVVASSILECDHKKNKVAFINCISEPTITNDVSKESFSSTSSSVPVSFLSHSPVIIEQLKLLNKLTLEVKYTVCTLDQTSSNRDFDGLHNYRINLTCSSKLKGVSTSIYWGFFFFTKTQLREDALQMCLTVFELYTRIR